MKIKNVVDYLNQIAPPSYQESYDNSGLIVGDVNWDCKGVLTCLDSTEAVVDEAIANGCNLIVAHHPIVFSGLKKITGRTYIEKVIIKAIKNDIAIFAIHTNLDNVKHGVNGVWANALGLINQKILSPKRNQLKKLVFYVPQKDADKVLNAVYVAGGGAIGNYDECSFTINGIGSFKPNNNANPSTGKIGKKSVVEEQKIEVLVEDFKVSSVLTALKNAHPYEEVAYEIYPLENSNQEIGAGIIGELKNEQETMSFLKFVKDTMGCGCLKYTELHKDTIQKVAICGGSGSFLLEDAKRHDADIFITADFKYHQFFDAENQLIIADIGHYESEQLTIIYLADSIRENFTTFAVLLTKVNTNPIKYL